MVIRQYRIMASQIGWIDFSPQQRNRVKKFMDLMGMGSVQDELGVGVIRDAMSNELFPGFSTLYTRAKYFFITPYILLERDSKEKRNQSGKNYFTTAEINTNKTIKEFYKSHSKRVNESYFGKEKNDGKLKRQPSEIYWNGITKLHLVNTNASLDQLLLDKHSTMEELLSNNRGDDTAKEQGENKLINPVNVEYSTEWLHEVKKNGLTLSRIEAQTLRDRLKVYTPNSLPAELVSNTTVWEKYKLSAIQYKAISINNPIVHFIEDA